VSPHNTEPFPGSNRGYKLLLQEVGYAFVLLRGAPVLRGIREGKEKFMAILIQYAPHFRCLTAVKQTSFATLHEI
jgi:hypothetical protein